jgi:hypothetical protein
MKVDLNNERKELKKKISSPHSTTKKGHKNFLEISWSPQGIELCLRGCVEINSLYYKDKHKSN